MPQNPTAMMKPNRWQTNHVGTGGHRLTKRRGQEHGPGTKPGGRRVPARWGWVGENSDVFSILVTNCFMQELLQTFSAGSQSGPLIVTGEPTCYAPHL